MVNITEGDFEELLNEAPAVVILGRDYYPGTILRKCDPVQFNIEYWNYVHAVEEEIENES